MSKSNTSDPSNKATRVEIYQQSLKNGKIAILRGGLHTNQPNSIMDAAVLKYVGTTDYNEFVEVFLDNPWVRVIIHGINELKYESFDKQTLQQ